MRDVLEKAVFEADRSIARAFAAPA